MSTSFASPTMCKIFLVLACFAGTGHGQRGLVRASATAENQMSARSIQQGSPLKALSGLLLTRGTEAAFSPSVLGGRPTIAVRQSLELDRHVGRPSSVLMNTDIALQDRPLPPFKNGFLQRFRDLFGYLKNPTQFILERSQELGPVFTMYMFFQPVVVVGGKEAVKEFITEKELRSSVIYAQLPETFLELHTKWGALNQDANQLLFKQARDLFADVLAGPEALSYHCKTIEPQIEEYVDKLAERVRSNPDQEIFLVPEIIELCLQMFAKTFTGQGLTKEQVQMYIDYNAALLSIGTFTNGYKKGKAALDSLKVDHLQKFHALDSPDIPMDTPGKFYHDKLFGREGFEDEDRVATGMVLFVWGAYVECASLMVDSLALMKKKSMEARDNVEAEFQQRKSSGQRQSDVSFWNGMPYTKGVLRETLRLAPPGAGVPRFGEEDFLLQGYRVPAKMGVMMEPRIGNMDPDLYAEPTKFEPYRWVKPTAEEPATKCPFQGTALKLGVGSWFPGGNGAHKCPGVPLAELVSSIFLAKMSERFESWSFSGSGLDKDGNIDYVHIPVLIPPDNLGLKFQPVKPVAEAKANIKAEAMAKAEAAAIAEKQEEVKAKTD